MKILVEVVWGLEGSCLTVGDEHSSTRVAGPKPWGGGHTTHTFKVDIEALREAINEYSQSAEVKPS